MMKVPKSVVSFMHETPSCWPESDKQLHTLPFDLYERYSIAASLISSLRRGASCSVLDVGGHSSVLWPGFPSLVSAFVPDARAFVIDLHREPGLTNYAVGSGAMLPFKDETFDFVLAQDTLEHIAPAERQHFIRELLRVSRDIVFLSFPFFTALNVSCDRLVYRFIELRKNVELPALKEHLAFGLPDLATIGDWVRDTSFPFAVWKHGNALVWLQMMIAKNHLWAQGVPEFEEELDSVFNLRFGVGDYRDPCYRSFVLIGKNRSEKELAAAVEGCRGEQISDSDQQAVYSLCEAIMESTSSVEVERRAQHAINLIDRLGTQEPQRVTDLSTRLAEKSAEARHLCNLLDQIRPQLADACTRLADASSQAAHYKNLLDEREQRVADLETRLAEKSSEAQHYRNLFEGMQPRLDDATARLAEATSRADHYQGLFDEQHEQAANLESQLAANASQSQALLEREKQSRIAAEDEMRTLKARLARFPWRFFVH